VLWYGHAASPADGSSDDGPTSSEE
jgi:hypothetical protein